MADMRMICMVFAGLLWVAGCSSKGPDLSTPEGMGLHAVGLVARGDWDGFKGLAENPNAALLRETGSRPRPGSYAEMMVREGETLMRSQFDEVAKNPSVKEEGLGAVARPQGGAEAWLVSITKADGSLIGVDVQVIRVEGKLRIAGFALPHAGR